MCYIISWASTTEKVLRVNSKGEPIDTSGNAYTTTANTTAIPSSAYTYNEVFVPSNGTNKFTFDEVYRSALRDIYTKI